MIQTNKATILLLAFLLNYQFAFAEDEATVKDEQPASDLKSATSYDEEAENDYDYDGWHYYLGVGTVFSSSDSDSFGSINGVEIITLGKLTSNTAFDFSFYHLDNGELYGGSIIHTEFSGLSTNFSIPNSILSGLPPLSPRTLTDTKTLTILSFYAGFAEDGYKVYGILGYNMISVEREVRLNNPIEIFPLTGTRTLTDSAASGIIHGGFGVQVPLDKHGGFKFEIRSDSEDPFYMVSFGGAF